MKTIVRGSPHTYVIWAEPLPYVRSDAERRIWDSSKQERFNQVADLLEQHGSKPLFKGPVALEVYFYIKSHDKAKKRPGPHDTFNYSGPSLAAYLRFFEEMAIGTVLTHSNQIAQVTSFKRWDLQPRTEVIIKEIEP